MLSGKKKKRMLSGRSLGTATAAVHEKLDIQDPMAEWRAGRTPRTPREKARRGVSQKLRCRGHSGNEWNRRSP